MMKLKLICMSVIAGLLFSAEAFAQNDKSTIGKPKITKCKDKNGVWHYGSSNLYECADSSKITTFNERGVKVKQVDEVKTQEQLAAEEKNKEKIKNATEKRNFEELEKRRILTVYQTEEEIERARKEKMRSYDRKVEQHTNYIVALENRKKSLESKSAKSINVSLKRKYAKEVETLTPKAEASKKRISELMKEKIQSNDKYDQDLVIFKKYKS